MTFIVFLVLAGLVAVGLSIVLRAMRNRSDSPAGRTCPKCRQENPDHAKFCAHCGEALT